MSFRVGLFPSVYSEILLRDLEARSLGDSKTLFSTFLFHYSALNAHSISKYGLESKLEIVNVQLIKFL